MSDTTHSVSLQQRLSSYTSLIRLPDWSRLAHKLALLLVLASGVVAVVLSIKAKDSTSETAMAGVLGLLGVYGAWALTRELLVDDDWMPLLGAATALWVIIVGRDLSLYMLYATLFMVSMVQRNVGPRVTIIDALVMGGFTFAGMHYNLNMLFWFALFVAFILDAVLRERAWRQMLFAVACAGGGVYFDTLHKYMMRELGFVTLPPWGKWLFVLALVCFVLCFFVKRDTLLADDGQTQLTNGRFRAGVVVALLCGVTALFAGNIGLLNVGLVWAAMPAVGLGLLIHVARRFMS